MRGSPMTASLFYITVQPLIIFFTNLHNQTNPIIIMKNSMPYSSNSKTEK